MYKNSLTLVGFIGQAPDIKMKADGEKYATFSLATARPSNKLDENGQRIQTTDWHRCTVWNEKVIEVVQKYLRKGSHVLVDGSIHYNSYTKAGEEHPRSIANVTVARLLLLDRPETQATPTKTVDAAGRAEETADDDNEYYYTVARPQDDGTDENPF